MAERSSRPVKNLSRNGAVAFAFNAGTRRARRKSAEEESKMPAAVRKSHLRLAIGQCAREGAPPMGDKSPKATNKQAAQKQAKANVNTKNKNSATAAKQAVKGKK